MDPRKQRLNPKSDNLVEARLQEAAHLASRRTFDSPEELLRADRRQIQVPSEIADGISRRLSESPTASPPWWKRLFS